ncbi:DUF5305 domain-containing protein [Halovivax gelatinilyticus]|uniref:DUF5305 domain-containing protein n=1 Tax=Halovivax gelatinilyticus TaxID=2961597 RepID=UPI0020CA6890|nr:DUF5305 domain-containing protein [Halovivax gelatinilyticus]
MVDNPRIDLLLARYGRTLLVALAIVGVLSLAVSGWAVASPNEETVSQQVELENVETTLETSAVVESDGLWPEGTELSNEPVYLRNATSTITLAPRTTISSGDGEILHDVALRHEAVRDDAVFWEDRETLERTEANVTDGVASSAVDVDIADVLDQQRTVERHVDGIGEVRTVVEVETHYRTGSASGDFALETEFVATDRAAWLDDPTPTVDDPQTETQLVTETDSRSLAFIGFFALFGSGALGAAWALNQRAPVDEKTARRAVHERRYAEWISRGSIPMWVGEHHIALDTLEDVVDVAIDTNNRVVHDRQRGLFAAVTDDVVYYYTDRGLWEETAWPNMELDDGSDEEYTPTGVGANAPLDPPFDADRSHETDRAPDERPADIDPDDEDAWNQI